MVDIINRYAVQEDEVLVRAAAAHIQAGEAFVAALHAGHHLDGLEHIGLAEEHRGIAHLGDGHFNRAKVGGVDAGFARGHHHGLLQEGRRFHHHVDHSVPLDVQRHSDGLIAQITVLKVVAASRNGEGVVAEYIGYGTRAHVGVFRKQTRADEGFTGFRVRYVAAYGYASLSIQKHGAEQ